MQKDINHAKSILSDLENKYGLISTSELTRGKESGSQSIKLKSDPNIEVYPHSAISRVVRMLDGQLWPQSSLRVLLRPPLVARAAIFGVPLRKAFIKAEETGMSKSRFMLLENSSGSSKGYIADLLIYVATDSIDKDLRVIEIWEDVLNTDEIFYCHAILNYKTEVVYHLDGSQIYMTEENKKTMFNSAKKIKGDFKEKHFSVDGKFSTDTAIDLMRAYFPIKELVDEAFEYQQIES